jgi:selenocysteine lyase/cysteine desulfurase
MAVFGLNCPFMKSPEKWTCGVEGVSALYLQEIKRRQPKVLTSSVVGPPAVSWPTRSASSSSTPARRSRAWY